MAASSYTSATAVMSDSEECQFVEESRPQSSKRSRPSSTKRTPATKKRNTRANTKAEATITKQVIPTMAISKDFCDENLLGRLYEILEFQGWHKLFSEEVFMDEELVRSFYKGLKTEVRGKLQLVGVKVDTEEHWFTMADLAGWIDVPMVGYASYQKGTWPKDIAAHTIMARVTESSSPTDAARDLPPLQRVLHRILVQNFFPRMQKHSVVSINEFIILDKLLQHDKVNFPQLMVDHMIYAKTSPSHGLPYPGLVKRILQNLHEFKPQQVENLSIPLSSDNLEKLGLMFQEGEGWVKKPPRVPTEVAQPTVDAGEGNPPVVQGIMVPSEVLQALVNSVEGLKAEVAELKERFDVLEEKGSSRGLEKEVANFSVRLDDFEVKGNSFIRGLRRLFQVPPSP